jgi:hypothetical protein
MAAGFNVEVAVADGLPNIIGDVTGAALGAPESDQQRGEVRRQRAVDSGSARPCNRRVQAWRKPWTWRAVIARGRAVFFTVEDRGLGIDADDRSTS